MENNVRAAALSETPTLAPLAVQMSGLAILVLVLVQLLIIQGLPGVGR